MRLDIRYRTRFAYTGPVRESQNELRACPASDVRQQLVSYRVSTTPAARVFSFTDYWGTRVDTFGVTPTHRNLEVVAEAVVETRYTPLVTISPRMEAQLPATRWYSIDDQCGSGQGVACNPPGPATIAAERHPGEALAV